MKHNLLSAKQQRPSPTPLLAIVFCLASALVPLHDVQAHTQSSPTTFHVADTLKTGDSTTVDKAAAERHTAAFGLASTKPTALCAPNPATTYTGLMVRHLYGKIQIEIADLSGHPVRSETRFVEGNEPLRLAVADLDAGSYFVRVKGTTGTAMCKLVVQH